MATTAVSEQGGEASGSSKGGRNLRKRETAACPLCFNTFFSGELESHVSACLYFLEEAGERKKHKKAKTSPLKNTNKMVIDSATPQKLSTPNPKSNISPLNSHTNSVPSPHHRQSSDTKSPPKLSTVCCHNVVTVDINACSPHFLFCYVVQGLSCVVVLIVCLTDTTK